MTTVQAVMSGVPFQLLTAVTTGTGTAVAIPMSFRNHSFIVNAVAATTGAIQLETSNDINDSQTWAPLTATTTAIVTNTDVLVEFAGIIQFVRARVTTTIAGGTTPGVTVTYYGGKNY